MVEKILARRDLAFLLYDWLQVERLTERARYREHSRETFDAALDIAERIATDLFYPHNRKADLDEPRFDGERVHLIPEIKTALDAFVAAGLMSAEHDEAYGGMQLPLVVAKACFAYFKGANVATSAYAMLTAANANLLLAHGSAAQIDAFARPQLAGRFFGTMCLSEPQAGSSLADVATRAVARRRLAARTALSPDRQQDVDLGRRTRTVREHRSPGARQDPGRRRHAARRREGHLAVRRAEAPGERGRHGPGDAASRLASATMSCSPGSTTRWATAARPTACSISAKAGTGPRGEPAPSATGSARPAAASPACST